MMAVKKGFFISLEGSEGAGKSTQHERIVEWLSDQGETVTRRRFGTLARRISSLPTSDSQQPYVTRACRWRMSRVPSVQRSSTKMN